MELLEQPETTKAVKHLLDVTGHGFFCHCMQYLRNDPGGSSLDSEMLSHPSTRVVCRASNFHVTSTSHATWWLEYMRVEME